MIERIWLVLALAALVIVLIVVLRRRPVVRGRQIDRSTLPGGVYLLTSDGCDTCERARTTLTRHQVAYTELTWQKNPELFESLGVDAVPSVLLIDRSGAGTWWRGGVPRASSLLRIRRAR